jgi:hypothetical protein
MPFVNDAFQARLSDLIFDEYIQAGYTREVINVTPPAASAPVTIGTVVFRAKSLDPAAPYVVITANTALVDTNEFAVVFGDGYGFNPSFVPNAVEAGRTNAVSIQRGPIQLKDYYIKQVHSTLTAAEIITLKELLKNQGVIVEVTL